MTIVQTYRAKPGRAKPGRSDSPETLAPTGISGSVLRGDDWANSEAKHHSIPRCGALSQKPRSAIRGVRNNSIAQSFEAYIIGAIGLRGVATGSGFENGEEAALISKLSLRHKHHWKVAALSLAVIGLAGTSASAQPWPNTRSVNDCTLIPQPDQMRMCIEAYQGAPVGPSAAPSSSPLLLPQPSTPSSPQSSPSRPVAPPPRLAPH
jgi:hypothetical protein